MLLMLHSWCRFFLFFFCLWIQFDNFHRRNAAVEGYIHQFLYTYRFLCTPEQLLQFIMEKFISAARYLTIAVSMNDRSKCSNTANGGQSQVVHAYKHKKLDITMQLLFLCTPLGKVPPWLEPMRRSSIVVWTFSIFGSKTVNRWTSCPSPGFRIRWNSLLMLR